LAAITSSANRVGGLSTGISAVSKEDPKECVINILYGGPYIYLVDQNPA